MEDKRIKARLKELNEIFSSLSDKKKILLRNTIETVAFMDIELKDLENSIQTGQSTTPEKQLYSTMVKTRDVLMKKLLAELPEDPKVEEVDEFDLL